MKNITLKARAKINLSLDVLGKRPDGYHELQMVMQTVGLYDQVYLERIEKPKVSMKTNLPWLPADERNLAFAAVERMRLEYGIEEGVFIALEKRIPVAAGLAGGSADCAAALVGMNRLFDLGLSQEMLAAHGAALGSDIPFCIYQGTMLAEGIGCDLTPLSSCPLLFLVLAKPQVSVSTKFVYQNLRLTADILHPDTDAMIQALAKHDISEITKHMGNVLETVTIPRYPIIARIKENLLQHGAMGALMSGSGPTVYGFFSTKEQARAAAKVLRHELNLREVYVTATFQPKRER